MRAKRGGGGARRAWARIRDGTALATYVERWSPSCANRAGVWSTGRGVKDGSVRVFDSEIEILLRERIRVVIRSRGLPQVPAEVCSLLAPAIEKLTAVHQGQMLRIWIDRRVAHSALHGCVDPGARGRREPDAHGPVRADRVSAHDRARCHADVGESTSALLTDIQKTLYQVEHISGRSGTEYTPPSCATMETNGLCVRRDTLCERIGGPLGYYRKKKVSPSRAEGTPADLPLITYSGDAHQDEKDHDGEQVRRPRRQDEGQADDQNDHDEQGDDPDHEVKETRIHCLCAQ